MGGQRFQAKTDTINLRRGLPLPSDAFTQLLDDHGHILQGSAFIDDSSNVVIKIFEYDPLEVAMEEAHATRVPRICFQENEEETASPIMQIPKALYAYLSIPQQTYQDYYL